MSDYSLRDRIRDLGYQYPSKYIAWRLGTVICNKWVKHPLSGGRLPEKRLMTKTSGKGSHVFAVYPHEFVSVMDGTISDVMESLGRQGWLFEPEGWEEEQEDDDDQSSKT